MNRDPLIDPRDGDVVQSSYYSGDKQIGRRIVLAVSAANVRYMTGTGTKTVERNCLPHTWRKWCREHKARTVSETTRDY